MGTNSETLTVPGGGCFSGDRISVITVQLLFNASKFSAILIAEVEFHLKPKSGDIN